jgi:hypothetical protein
MPTHVLQQGRDNRAGLVATSPSFCSVDLLSLFMETGFAMLLSCYYCSYASTYQMLRGTLVLFAGTFTILILRRQLFIHNWLGMVLITAGAALVGASSVIYQDAPGAHNNTLLAGPAGGVGLAAYGALEENRTASSALGWGASTGSSLHYSAGISRVASRGLLGWGQADGLPTAGGLPHAAAAASGVPARSWLGGFAGVLGLGESSGAGVAAAPLFGDMLVVAAQMFTALQFIMEEKFLVKYKVGEML